MINSFQSKPERKLFEQLHALHDSLKRNQRVFSVSFKSASRRRQIDILDKDAKIAIEYDGQVHFVPLFGESSLKKVKEADDELNRVLIAEGYKLIRVSFDQYKKGQFSNECIQKIMHAVESSEKKLYLIGEAYYVESGSV